MVKISLVSALLSITASTLPAYADDLVERGAYLVKHVAACGNCHSPLDATGEIAGKELSGRFVISTPGFDAYAPNITPAGIGGWSDEELSIAIREGIRPDGTLIGPPMPIELYRRLSDSDLAAIIAYLRTVPAVESDLPRSRYRIELPSSYGPPVSFVADVAPGETVEYGAYLAGPVAHCIECHTPMTEAGHFDYASRLGAGGQILEGPWGIAVTANLTSAPDALARWSDEEVINMIRTGHRPDGSAMAGPMGYSFYRGMAEQDVRAIVAYLRTLPARVP
ncbi:c-type cytochrome [Pontibaca salina]|uniref:C-type cytochrome n=1 Tax=Pontibaca salina TaxID=2795731 RepID=A0A934HPQ8_9RHOB|nr:c-type cytochrome [Pontibaca salina]MBI6629462.1 c-type cytochrome [Pontibaca salina]